jgi:hypothetical protein
MTNHISDELVLQHDWVIERGSQFAEFYGLLGYPKGTYVCYGSDHFWVPITVETFGIVTLVGSLLILCAWCWRPYDRDDDNAA